MAPFEDDNIPRTTVDFVGGAALEGEDLGHYFVVVAGHDHGRVIEIGAETLTIGRDPKQALVFPDGDLSRQHARVSLVVGYLVIEDLKSTNGTFVNGKRITEPTELREGNTLRLGKQLLKYERRDRKEVARAEELKRDLQNASAYVASLLPAPIVDGPVATSWRYHPSAQLGGDAFGYGWLDEDRFVFYLIDVSGHGVGAAMHSVSVMNVLRQRALPDVDLGDPVAVLSRLNDRFQMDSHNDMYFTMWYGTYKRSTRTLAYSSAGHHPAYLVTPGGAKVEPLGRPNLMIGAIPESDYEVSETLLDAGSAIHLFSDGVFEFRTTAQRQIGLDDFIPWLTEPLVPGLSEPERLYRRVTSLAGTHTLPDDFSLLTLTFQ